MIIEPASTMTQSHWGLPSGFGHFIPIFFSFLTRSSAVESACLVDLQVAIIKQSAIDDLFDKSITLRLSAFESSKIDKILSDNENVLIFTSKSISLISNFCWRDIYFFVYYNCPGR